MQLSVQKVVTAVLAVGLVFTGSTVLAADTVAVKVRFHDLNPVSAEGSRILHQRIDRAARQVAGLEPEARELVQYAHWRKRYELALARAVQQLHPQLAAAREVRLSQTVAAPASSGSH